MLFLSVFVWSCFYRCDLDLGYGDVNTTYAFSNQTFSVILHQFSILSTHTHRNLCLSKQQVHCAFMFKTTVNWNKSQKCSRLKTLYYSNGERTKERKSLYSLDAYNHSKCVLNNSIRKKNRIKWVTTYLYIRYGTNNAIKSTRKTTMATHRQFKCMYAANAPLAAIDLKIKAKSDIDEREKRPAKCAPQDGNGKRMIVVPSLMWMLFFLLPCKYILCLSSVAMPPFQIKYTHR